MVVCIVLPHSAGHVGYRINAHNRNRLEWNVLRWPVNLPCACTTMSVRRTYAHTRKAKHNISIKNCVRLNWICRIACCECGPKALMHTYPVDSERFAFNLIGIVVCDFSPLCWCTEECASLSIRSQLRIVPHLFRVRCAVMPHVSAQTQPQSQNGVSRVARKHYYKH